MKAYLQKHNKQSYCDNWSTPDEIYDFFCKGSLNFKDPCPLYCRLIV